MIIFIIITQIMLVINNMRPQLFQLCLNQNSERHIASLPKFIKYITTSAYNICPFSLSPSQYCHLAIPIAAL